MLISKKKENVPDNDLMVDTWEVNYEENKQTGKVCLVEKFNGQTKIKQTNEQMYLGFVISSTGNNMANINQLKKKSFGVIRKIFNKLNNLNLENYYFECSMIFMNAILRPSILYACESYYNLKEYELRQIERIEENYLRKVLKTSKGCPIVQIYLEMGHTPARHEIQKTRLLFLQYILQQSDDSKINQFLKLQFEQPTRGDWGSTCIQDLKQLGINESFEEIKLMTKNKFTKILKEKMMKNALIYLTGKQKNKGKEIQYTSIEMAEYLLPSTSEMTVDKKRNLFSVRNKMADIPANFQDSKIKTECLCGEAENMEHLYECNTLNEKEPILPYQKLYCGNINEQIQIFKRIEKCLEKRQDLKNSGEKLPCDPEVIRCVLP